RSAVSVADAKSSGRISPRDIAGRTDDAAGTAFDAAAPVNRGLAVFFDLVVSHRTGRGARLFLAPRANLLIDYLQMWTRFVDLERQGRELVVAVQQRGRAQVVFNCDRHSLSARVVFPHGSIRTSGPSAGAQSSAALAASSRSIPKL